MFAAVFYAYGLVLVVRASTLAALGLAEAAPVVAGALALYAGSVLTLASARRSFRRGGFTRRFRANVPAVFGLSLVLVMVCLSLLAPLLVAYDPTDFVDPARTRLAAPSLEHPMGTDRFGRDIWARIVYGGRTSLGISTISVLLSMIIALLVGCVAGLSGGWVDDILSRFVDGMLSFPRQLFVLTVVAFFTNSVPLLIAAIALTSWMRIARLVRGEVIRLKGMPFASAALATGVTPARLLIRHILPNAMGPTVVAATLQVGAVILLEAYLSFLGLGIQPPAPSWGAMVFEARDALISAWWVPMFPALTITLSVVAFNLLGDGLRDALDVRLHARGD